MTQPSTQKLGPWTKLLLAAIGLASIAGPVQLGFVNGAPIRAQSTPTANASLPSFEVVSIKQNRSGDRLCVFAAAKSPGRFMQTNCSIKMLIEYAYMQGQPQPWVHPYMFLKDDQLVGGPSWISTDRYDIEAKVPDAVAAKYEDRTWEERTNPTRQMVQSMLADRFNLQVRRETREGPVYVLVVGKGGSKFSQASIAMFANVRTQNAEIMKNPSVLVKGIAPCATGTGCFHSLTAMSALAETLSRFPEVGRPVVDQTGLKGIYYLDFYWARAQAPNTISLEPENGGAGPGNLPIPEPSGPSIFSALKEQLGLRLEPTRGPIEYLVIDRIERPSEN